MDNIPEDKQREQSEEESYNPEVPFSGIDYVLQQSNGKESGHSSPRSFDGDQGQSRPRTGFSSRAPSTKNSRAHLSRTSMYAQSEPLVYSDDDENVDDNVLITELQDENVDDSNQRDDGVRRWLTGSAPPDMDLLLKRSDDVTDDAAGYDTDLEDQIMEEVSQDTTGRDKYVALCHQLGVVPASYFCRHIKEPELTLHYHGLGVLGTRAIARVLRENISLEKLDLTGNWMTGEGAMYVTRMMLDNDYITDLNLSENALDSEATPHIARIITYSTSLKKLNLSGNAFGDEDAETLAASLEENKLLHSVNLSRNHIGIKGGQVLGPAIGANDVLDELDLSWNRLRLAGAVAVCKGLKENVRLKRCNLSWNGFGPVGGKALAEAITANQSLLELNVAGNRLSLETALQMAKSLKVNEELSQLKMGHNNLSTAGALCLVEALRDNESSSIKLLDLSDIPVEIKFVKVIEQLASRDIDVIYGPTIRSANSLVK